MSATQRSFWNAFWLAMALVFAAVAANAQELGSSRSRGNADFGMSPVGDVTGRAALRGYETDQTSVPSLRTRLLRERVLDESDFATPASTREPYSVRTRRYEVEDLPPIPHDSIAMPPMRTPSAPRRDVEPDRKPAPVPTAREKIERRYTDPRTVRLLNQLTDRKSVV